MNLRPALVPGVAAAVTLLAVTGCASSRTIHAQRSFSLGGTRLVIDDDTADLQVVPGRGPGVAVQRWLSGTAAKPGHATWTLTGGTLRLSIDCTGIVFSCGARFRVAVPRGVSVVVRSGSASAAVSGLAGSVVIDGGSGGVRLSDVSGPLRVSTGAGDVTGAGIRSAVARATSDQGNVTIGFADAPRLAVIRCGAGNATARVPTAGHRYRVVVTSGTGTASSRVPDDRQSRSAIRVSSRSGGATVVPAT